MFWKKKNQEEFEWRDYRDKSYEELEKEVDEAYGKAMFIRNIKLLFVAIVLIFVCQDVIAFWFNFGLPKSAKMQVEEVIDVALEPEQYELEEEEFEEVFQYTTLEDKDIVNLRKQAEVSLSGRVVAKNYLFWGNYLPGGKRVFQSAAMMDLGLVWGDLANLKNLESFVFYSAKDVTKRTMYPKLKLGVSCPPIPWPYVRSHMTNIHAIPASAEIMSAMIHLRKNQPVKVEGYLVDVQIETGAWLKTYTDRTIASLRARGNSPSETIYITKLQVGNKIYE